MAISNSKITEKGEIRSASSESPPLVSIGLPVKDGENYIAETINSILKQSFQNFELIISDNASTDRTNDICQQFAARDYRIRYYRNLVNIGAAPNYDRTFELARGRYFKWIAHDDLLASTYLAECVEALEERPDAVLCNSAVALIDDVGKPVKRLEPPASQSVASQPSKRLTERLTTYYFYDFFGVFRREVLVGTPLHGPYHNSDIGLLAIVALRGPTIIVPEYAFYYRVHEATYSRSVRPREHSEWHTAGRAKPALLPAWRIFREVSVRVAREVDDPVECRRCYLTLLQYLFSPRTVDRELRYVVRTFAPWAGDWKRALLRVFPGHSSGLTN